MITNILNFFRKTYPIESQEDNIDTIEEKKSLLPQIGIEIGKEMYTNEPIYMDPVNWFKGNIISNPSLMILGMPGSGKSSLVVKIIFGLVLDNVIPIIIGDIKSEYSKVIQSLNGQVIHLNNRCETINILKPNVPSSIPNDIKSEITNELIGDVLSTLITLLEINRNGTISDYERSLLEIGIEIIFSKEDYDIESLINLYTSPSRELLEKFEISKEELISKSKKTCS